MPSHSPVPKQQTWKPQATAKPRCPGLPWALPLAQRARQGLSPHAIARRVGTVSTGAQAAHSPGQHTAPFLPAALGTGVQSLGTQSSTLGCGHRARHCKPPRAARLTRSVLRPRVCAPVASSLLPKNTGNHKNHKNASCPQHRACLSEGQGTLPADRPHHSPRPGSWRAARLWEQLSHKSKH